jgi:HicA toxin of bacterial toxin-antitoxin,
MPPAGAIKRRDLIRYLRRLGYTGPYSGGKHQYMQLGDFILPIPNPHKGEIGWPLLKRILEEAEIDRTTWENL